MQQFWLCFSVLLLSDFCCALNVEGVQQKPKEAPVDVGLNAAVPNNVVQGQAQAAPSPMDSQKVPVKHDAIVQPASGSLGALRPNPVNVAQLSQKQPEAVNVISAANQPVINKPIDSNVGNVNQPIASGVNNVQQQQPIAAAAAPPPPNSAVNPPAGGAPPEQVGAPADRPPSPPHLADTPECAVEINRYCPDVLRTSDHMVLACMVDKSIDGKLFSPQCHHIMWEYKVALTKDDRLRQASLSYCKEELAGPAKECLAFNNTSGALLPCLLDFKENMTQPAHQECRGFLTKIETIIFGDYHLISRFVSACEDQIRETGCGRVDNTEDAAHSQGSTIECMVNKLLKDGQNPNALIKSGCRKELLRLTELQSDDYHLDRPLFFACRDDRDKFCADVMSGEGRVYGCLVKHANDQRMSGNCRQKIIERQQLVAVNYKSSHQLVRHCEVDIHRLNCEPREQTRESFYLSYILLCLENGLIRGEKVMPECHNEMFNHRKALAGYYGMSPQVVLACNEEIHSPQCTPYVDPKFGGQMLHCLMAMVKLESAPPPQQQAQAAPPFNRACYQAVNDVIKAAGIAQNVRVDPVLMASCGKAIQGLCSSVQSESEVISCLMDNIESQLLTDQCENHLLEVQFFLARDFTLDERLYRACHFDATEKCGAKPEWIRTYHEDKGGEAAGKVDQDPNTAQPHDLVLPCLFRRTYVDDEKEQLQPHCATEIRRIIRERASKVQLVPQVAEACVHDLGAYCSVNDPKRPKLDPDMPRGEMFCLELNLDKLDEKCKGAVAEFAEAESKDYRLMKALATACNGVIQRHCQEHAAKELDHGDVLRCLHQNRGAPEMTRQCRSYVTHYELVSMSDYRFSYRFMKACSDDVTRNCADLPKDKWSIIKCLSTTVFHTDLLGKPKSGAPLTSACRLQLQKEYLMVRENQMIRDTILLKDCKNDISHLCPGFQDEGDVLECLRDRRSDLGTSCLQYVFQQERLQMADNSFDAVLQRACGSVIAVLCPNVDRSRVLRCLKMQTDSPKMIPSCLEVVTRREREQMADVRLQPGLREACDADIQTFCASELEAVKNLGESQIDDANNRVLTCLRKRFARKESGLRPQCTAELRHVILISHLDGRADPTFFNACKRDITTLCSTSLLTEEGSSIQYGKIDISSSALECMRNKYYEGKEMSAMCKEEMERRTAEEMVDLQVDASLFRACALEVKQFCKDVRSGGGRQIECLLKASESTNVQMGETCRTRLEERKRLWKKVFKEAAPDTVADFASLISDSPIGNTLLLTIGIILLVIFVGGLFCGRITKIVRQEIKNR